MAPMVAGYGEKGEPLRFQATQSPHQVTDLEHEAATAQSVNERLPTLSCTMIADCQGCPTKLLWLNG